MPAYSFKERFIPLIKSGQKKQTIRAKRKYQAKAGDKLYLFYGMRTKHCMRILDTTCKSTAKIEIKKNGSVYINGRKLTLDDKISLAFADGFRWEKKDNVAYSPFDMMMKFWKQNNELPFKGDIIYW